MKAADILRWVIEYSINGELLNYEFVPEEGEEKWEQNEEWWYSMFGNTPPHPVESGNYLYFYEPQLAEDGIYDSKGAYVSPDFMIEIPKRNGFDYIYFYKLED